MTITQAPEVSLSEYIDFVAGLVADAVPDLLAHMDDEAPNECVGLIWADGVTQRLINQARSSVRFSVSQGQMATSLAERGDGALLSCFYHSHPGGNPHLSSHDKESLHAQFNRDLFIPWAVVTHTEIAIFWLDDDNFLRHRWVWDQ